MLLLFAGFAVFLVYVNVGFVVFCVCVVFFCSGLVGFMVFSMVEEF